LKKEEKNLKKVGWRVATPRTQMAKSFCFFFQKEVLTSLPRLQSPQSRPPLKQPQQHPHRQPPLTRQPRIPLQ
jgi:hypothetical protein